MEYTTALFFIIAVASAICNSHAASAGYAKDGSRNLLSPHLVGAAPNNYLYPPAVFVLRFYKNGKYVRTCRGSELSINKWLTAAECLDNEKYDMMVLEDRIHGVHQRYIFYFNRLEYTIHPQYDKNTNEHNIALITPPEKVSRVPYYVKTQHIKLPKEAGENYQGQHADILLDWTNTTEEFDLKESFEFYSIRTDVLDPSNCKPSKSSRVNKGIVCVSANYRSRLSDDDIGIPLIIKEEDHSFKIIGMATTIFRQWSLWPSNTIEFTRIDQYLSWINAN